MMAIPSLVLALVALAQSPAAGPASPARDKLAVPGFRALEVEPALADLLSEVALTEAARFKALEVVGQSDVAALLGHERQQELLGCQDDSRCMAPIAGALGADYLLVGSIGRIGASTRVDLKIVDLHLARVVAREGETVSGRDEAVVEAVQRAVLQLLEPLAGPPAAAPSAASAGAGGGDGHYLGVITCDPIPGETKTPLRIKVTLRIEHGQVEIQREIYHPQRLVLIGMEKGTGRVGSDGGISLSSAAAGMGWSFDAKYAGRREGSEIQLTGTQVWHLGSRPPFDRPCAIVATRSEIN